MKKILFANDKLSMTSKKMYLNNWLRCVKVIGHWFRNLRKQEELLPEVKAHHINDSIHKIKIYSTGLQRIGKLATHKAADKIQIRRGPLEAMKLW